MEKTLFENLLEIQKELKPIVKDSENPFFKSKYADLNAVYSEAKPLLIKYNLLLTQPVRVENGVSIVSSIIKSDKEEIKSEIAIPQITDPQKIGACITYFRRFTLKSLLALEEEDDDGNFASGKEKTIEVEAPWKTCPICGKEHNGPRQRCAECFAKNLTL